MNNLEPLEQKAYDQNVKVHDYYLGEESLAGLYINGHVAINTSVKSLRKRTCVIAEELGHHCTSSGNILDQNDVRTQKQEYKARVWGYNESIGLIGIVEAFNHGCQNLYEMAEYLDVTEEFLNDALNTYRDKYGICVTIDNYTIYFIPCLTVLKNCNSKREIFT